MNSASFGNSNKGVQLSLNYGSLIKNPSETDPGEWALLSTMCFPRNHEYVADENLFDSINEALFNVECCRVALVGIGGVGKSSLAKEYLYRAFSGNQTALRLWIDASSIACAIEGYREIAHQMNLLDLNGTDRNVFERVHAWLRDTNKPWALVLDNINEDLLIYHLPLMNQEGILFGNENDVVRHSLLSSLPESRHRHGRIILTTRNIQTAQQFVPSHAMLNIGPMKEELALKLLSVKLRFRADRKPLRKLIQRLGSIPFLLCHAAAFLNFTADSDTLSEKIDNYFGAALQGEDVHFGFKDLLSRIFERIDESALDKLALMSCFEPTEIKESLIFHRSKIEQKEFISKWEEMRNRDDLRELKKYCLIDTGTDRKTLTMHRLTQAAIRDWLDHCENTDYLHTQFITILCLTFSTGAKHDNRPTRGSCYPHVVRAAAYKPKNSSSQTVLMWAILLLKGAIYAEAIKDVENMEDMSFKAREVLSDLLDPMHRYTMKSTELLILASLLAGKWEDAIELAEETIPLFHEVFGPRHYSTLSITNYLALANWRLGRLGETERLLGISIQMSGGIYGVDHPQLLNVISNLARTYEFQGRWAESAALNSKVLQVRERIYGAEHPYTLASMTNFAGSLKHQGQLERSEELHSRVIDIRKRMLGPEHPETLASMNNIASICEIQGRLDEAEIIYRKLFLAYKTIRGPIHRDTIRARANLASNYRAQGLWKEAAATDSLDLRSLLTRETALGEDHPDILRGFLDLATIYQNEGQYEMAEDLQLRAIKAQKRLLGQNHSILLQTMSSLAVSYREQGKLQKAMEICRQVVDGYRATRGSEHSDTLASMANLVMLHFDQRDLDEAETLQSNVMHRRLRILDSDHPTALSDMDTLALIHQKQGRLKDAEEMQSLVVALRQKKLGNEHPDTLVSMQNLVSTLLEQKRWEEAKTFQKIVETGRERMFGRHHPETMDAKEILTRILQARASEEVNDRDSDANNSHSSSIINRFALRNSESHDTSSNQPIALDAVILFTSLLLKNVSFQDLCKSAMQDRNLSQTRVRRNLRKVLVAFACKLGQETQGHNYSNIVQFVREASVAISSRIIEEMGAAEIPSLEESDNKQIEEESPGEKLTEQHIAARSRTQDIKMTDGFNEAQPEIETPNEESDSDEETIPETLEIPEKTIMEDIQNAENFLFEANAFQVMEKEFHDFVFPCFRAIMMNWILKKHRAEQISNKQRQDLEVNVSELQHIPAQDVTVTFDDDNSIINKIKGRWENFTGEKWDWRPMRPYMRPLANGEARLNWRCTCGQARWAEVPLSFATTVARAPSSIVQSDASSANAQRGDPGPYHSNTSSQSQQSNVTTQSQTGNQTPSPHSSQRTSPSQPGTRLTPELHVFLVLRHSSLLRSSRRLAQTSVQFSSDDDFFSWIRSMYYMHRGFFPVWFGIHRYSHCEFFKFQRFRASGFAPLCPEYPSEQEKSYHFSPRPISPDPPISPHEFSDRFADQAWHHAFTQRAQDVWSKGHSKNASASYNVVQEKLPKRDTVLEEKDSSHEIFWGLYVVEKRAVGILALYSLAFLSPTFYFFFAWMFQWEHYGDLQNAAVPLTLSIGLIGTLFGIVSLNSPRFEGHAVIY